MGAHRCFSRFAGSIPAWTSGMVPMLVYISYNIIYLSNKYIIFLPINIG